MTGAIGVGNQARAEANSQALARLEAAFNAGAPD
jgi:hypothetical protein